MKYQGRVRITQKERLRVWNVEIVEANERNEMHTTVIYRNGQIKQQDYYSRIRNIIGMIVRAAHEKAWNNFITTI